MEGVFRVARGSLRHIDLIEAIRTKAATPVHGGVTRFEEFAGSFAADSTTLRLGSLRLASGLLRGAGQVAVTRQSGALAGVLNLEMRGSTEAARATMVLSGSVSAPVLKSGR